MARQALQHFLHLPENALHTREGSRSPRGEVAAAAAAAAAAANLAIHPEVHAAEIGPSDAPAAAASSDVEADMPQALWLISPGASCAASS